MTTENFKILFVQGTNRTNKKNETPIYCRITFNKKRKQITTGIYLESKYWNAKSQLVSKTHSSSVSINSKLDKIKSKLTKIFTILILQDKPFSIDDVYNLYHGKEIKRSETVLSYYNQYLEKIKQLIGIEIKETTYLKFKYVSNHLETFLKWKYNKKDFPIEELSLQFLDDFEFYLKTEKKQKQITINKTIQRFRTPIKLAISEGILNKDPFILYKTKRVRKTIVFLSIEELATLEQTSFKQRRLNIVRDLFIFCCYTGLAYIEMTTLENKHIQIGFDNLNWIKMIREKTQREISVPILPKAQEIIDKYKNDENKIFPRVSNQKFNSYLKEIAAISGIEKNLTHHIARKTFASTILLYNNVPMEIVSELLGHSSIITTQESYGKIVQKSISDEMKKISTILNSKN